MVPTNTEVFCTVYYYAGKVNLSKGHLESKKKIGGNHIFFIILRYAKINTKQ